MLQCVFADGQHSGFMSISRKVLQWMMSGSSRDETVILRNSYRESAISVPVSATFISRLQIFMQQQQIMILVLK